MTIEEKCYLYGSCKCQTAGCVVRPDNGCPVYRYFKDLIVKDYETRLRADMVAMLTGLSMKIGEIEDGYTEFDEENKRSLTMIPLESVERLIDGEINSLEEA